MNKLNLKKKNIGFILDSIFIFFMCGFLLISESYIIFKTINNLYIKNIFVPIYLVVFYILLLLVIYTINFCGCFNVWKSICENMDQLEYYK